jgi:hypothetical protein
MSRLGGNPNAKYPRSLGDLCTKWHSRPLVSTEGLSVQTLAAPYRRLQIARIVRTRTP